MPQHTPEEVALFWAAITNDAPLEVGDRYQSAMAAVSHNCAIDAESPRHCVHAFNQEVWRIDEERKAAWRDAAIEAGQALSACYNEVNRVAAVEEQRRIDEREALDDALYRAYRAAMSKWFDADPDTRGTRPADPVYPPREPGPMRDYSICDDARAHIAELDASKPYLLEAQ